MRLANTSKLTHLFSGALFLGLTFFGVGAVDASENIKFWATNYYVHLATEKADGVAIRTVTDKVLARVSKKDWCLGAIEGTIIVGNGENRRTFNYASKGTPKIDCTPFVSAKSRTKPWAIALGRTRWSEVNAPFGLGVKGFKLVPFRTIAVDPTVVPIGSVLYIEAAKGVKFVNAKGSEEIHDGFFFAADVGGAIKGNHIDVFTGLGPNTVFEFVKNKPDGTFLANIIFDQKLIDHLAAMHR